MNQYLEKAAVVTGGASGIGRALCTALAQRGARVVVADIKPRRRREDGGGRRGRRRAGAGPNGRRDQDAGCPESRGRRRGRSRTPGLPVQQRRGHPVRGGAGSEPGPLAADDRRQPVGLHPRRAGGLSSHAQAALRTHRQRGVAGRADTHALSAPYTAAKHAIVGLSTELRLEAEELGVKVSVACPGTVKTGVLDSTEFVGVQREGAIGEMTAFKKMDADDCARAILRGVERNEQIILDGAVHNRIFWWLYRLSPPLYSRLVKVGVREIRKHRIS